MDESFRGNRKYLFKEGFYQHLRSKLFNFSNKYGFEGLARALEKVSWQFYSKKKSFEESLNFAENLFQSLKKLYKVSTLQKPRKVSKVLHSWTFR